MTRCANCHKRTTRSPERYTLIRQSTPVYGCITRLYGVLCAACYRQQQAAIQPLQEQCTDESPESHTPQIQPGN